MKILTILLTLFYFSTSNLSGQNISIGLTNQSELEQATKSKLIRVLEEYDVQKWIFTDTIVIADKQIPHSHPVLTLNTKTQSDLDLLSVFIHENAHWLLVKKEEETNLAVKELREKFLEVPVGGGEGAMNEHSTYIHLIVNFLEYDGIKQIAGERAARAVLNRKLYYKWIYKQVLNDIEFFENLTRKYELKI